MEEKERNKQTRHKLKNKHSKPLRGTVSAPANTKGDLNELKDEPCSGLERQY